MPILWPLIFKTGHGIHFAHTSFKWANRCAEDILLAREAHFPATIADLYDPDEMPANLRAAHERNDETLERIYLGRRFKNDTERLETLFSLYTQMTTGKAAPGSADVSVGTSSPSRQGRRRSQP